MDPVRANECKRSVYVKLSLKVFVFSFLGLCVAVMVFSSTLSLSIMVDMSVKTKHKFSSLSNISHGLFSISRGIGVNNNSINSSNSLSEEKLEDILGNNKNSNSSRRKNKCSSCFQHNFNYVIQNEKICELYSTNQTIDLIILIMTVHKNIEQRSAIRGTWLSHTKKNTANVRYAFLLGEIGDNKSKEAVLKENGKYQDIIKEDFVDTYMNLTYKTIMGLKWAATKCAHAHYVMKTDDDMFVNVPNILKIFMGPDSQKLEKAVFGSCHIKADPIRDRKSKWFASEDSYPGKSYPGFCSGTGYVTSMHVANEVYKVSKSIPFFHLEDVYVSLCVKQLGFSLQPIAGFNAGRPKLDPCLYKGEELKTAHGLTPVMLRSIWQQQCYKKASVAETNNIKLKHIA